MTTKQVRDLLESRYPGLHDSIEEALAAAEARFNAQARQAPSEFLLEHTRRTAAITLKLAHMEGVDPFLPVLVALYHDTGKFHDGLYHQDGVPEEEHAAQLAGAMLAARALPQADIDAVLEALRALYDERLPCLGASRIVQDADRLDKLGPLGIGAFFTKATLRGRGLMDALAQALTRELTYATAAPRSMFTASGRQLATEQAGRTLAFFDQLLEQLHDWGIASFERRSVVLDEDFRSRDGAIVRDMRVVVAMLRACPVCGAHLKLSHQREHGVKCERFIARIYCTSCQHSSETSLCLPVIA